ncbi:hypothetical protein [Streptomyces sp. NPDC059258]|uniref:hypothetical protein n=1 Tax=unclassified Streptomyces TaxID=2593676 RepID=UPI0036D0D375
MTEEAVTRLRQAVRRHDRAQAAADRAREELAVVIADALRSGVRPRDVSKESGYTAEHIRRIARRLDVPRLREPTVTSLKKAEQGDDSAT